MQDEEHDRATERAPGATGGLENGLGPDHPQRNEGEVQAEDDGRSGVGVAVEQREEPVGRQLEEHEERQREGRGQTHGASELPEVTSRVPRRTV